MLMSSMLINHYATTHMRPNKAHEWWQPVQLGMSKVEAIQNGHPYISTLEPQPQIQKLYFYSLDCLL